MNTSKDGLDISKAETVEQFKELVEANQNGLFKIGPRKNRRKTTKGRYTQVIHVRKYIINTKLSEEDAKEAKEMLNKLTDNEIENLLSLREDYRKYISLNPSPYACRTKYIYHQQQVN